MQHRQRHSGGIGNRIGQGDSGSVAIWTPTSDSILLAKILFWGKVSEISGGQMPDKAGSSDFITVAGSPATYQVPNTAPYIAADTDKIWFTVAAAQRTVTTAELIGYDFSQTLVKYDDATPYTIREIIIIKAGEVLTATEENNLRDYMQLSVWWNNILSNYGYIKGNRGSFKSQWSVYTKMLSDFEGVAGDTFFYDPIIGDLTFVGDAVISTLAAKFGSSGLNAELMSSYAKFANSTNFDFGSGDFTIDCWWYPKNLTGTSYQFIFGQGDATVTVASMSVRMYKQVNKKMQFIVYDSANNALTSSLGGTVLAVNTWYHIALVRYGNTMTGYVNGVPNGTLDVTGKTLKNGNGAWAIGNVGEYFTASTAQGYIDEFRISKGIARWTADFSASLPSAHTID